MTMTPLRQRMADDLHLRNYSDRTIKAYLRCVSNFARHFGKSPDGLGPPHTREYQLYLVKQKQWSWAVFNQTVCALRFFYNTTLGCKEMIEEIPYPSRETAASCVEPNGSRGPIASSKESQTSNSSDDHLCDR